MATAKKTASKKTTSRTTKTKAAPVKKAPVKKASVKKKTTSKRASAKATEMRSFHISRDTSNFKSFQITRQTVYWIILLAFIIFVQLWILKLQIEVTTLIEAQQQELINL